MVLNLHPVVNLVVRELQCHRQTNQTTSTIILELLTTIKAITTLVVLSIRLLLFLSQHRSHLHQGPSKNIGALPPRWDFVYLGLIDAYPNRPSCVIGGGLTDNNLIIPRGQEDLTEAGDRTKFLQQYGRCHATNNIIPPFIVPQLFHTQQPIAQRTEASLRVHRNWDCNRDRLPTTARPQARSGAHGKRGSKSRR
jgi:hypothetical protein